MLYEIGDLLEIQGVEFKPRAYRKAAQTIETLGEDVTDIEKRGELEQIPGVGESIAAKIREFIKKGSLQYLNDLRSKSSEGVREMTEIEGIGPKTALTLHDKLGIRSIEELKRAAQEGKIRDIKGFGEKSEEDILESIGAFQQRKGRYLLGFILPIAEGIVEQLRSSEFVKQISVGGSIRRRKETVGDIDILATSSEPEAVMEQFCKLPKVEKVIARGKTKSTVRYPDNLQVDLRVIQEETYGAALQYFTGSKAHNIALRKIALDRGMKLSEYGLVQKKDNSMVAGKTEEEVYRALGLAWIPPELRENRGEIAAAQEHSLPVLVKREDIRGDLHVHTSWSEGNRSIEDMVTEARDAYEYEYIAICDHTKALPIARGMDEERIHEQMKEIEQLNRQMEGITILCGVEANINKEGNLDIASEVRRDLDLVVASIHSGFRQTEKELTERLLHAMHLDYVDVIAHPMGRLLTKRGPLRMDRARVFDAAADTGVFLEINGFPTRLDLPDHDCQEARNHGVEFVISTDSHDITHLRYMELGVATARRGWLEKGQVKNTLPLTEFRKSLDR
jgi:DNA polymerase (family 10)